MAAFPGLLYKSFFNSEITDNRRIIFEITSAEKTVAAPVKDNFR